jgi:hypothetical protein
LRRAPPHAPERCGTARRAPLATPTM